VTTAHEQFGKPRTVREPDFGGRRHRTLADLRLGRNDARVPGGKERRRRRYGSGLRKFGTGLGHRRARRIYPCETRQGARRRRGGRSLRRAARLRPSCQRSRLHTGSSWSGVQCARAPGGGPTDSKVEEISRRVATGELADASPAGSGRPGAQHRDRACAAWKCKSTAIPFREQVPYGGLLRFEAKWRRGFSGVSFPPVRTAAPPRGMSDARDIGPSVVIAQSGTSRRAFVPKTHRRIWRLGHVLTLGSGASQRRRRALSRWNMGGDSLGLLRQPRRLP